MTFTPLALATAAALLLTACGGGGGAGGGSTDGGDGGGGGAGSIARPRLVVKATSDDELVDVCDEKGAEVLGRVEGTDYSCVECPEGVEAQVFLEEIRAEACVEDADEDLDIGFPEGGGGTIPLFGDDPFQAIANQPAIERIGAPVANGRGYRGAGVIVAIIDTGISASHPAIAGHLAGPGYDFVDNDTDPSDLGNGLDDNGDGRVDEGAGHGTFVASLVLAVAPEAQILPIRALDSEALGTSSSVARAITFAVENGAAVINLSAGLQVHLGMIKQALEFAQSEGVLVIAAAGNRSIPSIDFPAALADAVAVAAVDGDDVIAPFTSYNQKVDLSAPGVDILGAHPLSPSGTARWSGTSFSTALVTGSFAALRGQDAESSSEGLIECLKGSSSDLDGKNPLFKDVLGDGRVDLAEATGGH